MVAAWALVANGPLGVLRWVGLRQHSRGLLVVAAGLLVIPLATGRAGDVDLWACCGLAATGLFRLALVRWPATPPPDPTPPPRRVAGKLTSRPVDASLQVLARGAGRFIGRLRPPERP